MAAELRLNVALDLAYFRQQLPKLSQAAAGFRLPIQVQVDAKQVRLELNKITARNFRININDAAIQAARVSTQKLKKSLDLLQKQSYEIKIKYVEEGKPGNLPAARGGARTTGGVIRSLNAAQTRSLYEAALSKGLVKDVARNNAKELRAELIRGLDEAGKDGISGLIQGLKSGKGAMKGVASAVGNDFIASLKQVWQIASPSKKTEKIGEQLGEGLEIGVVNSFDDASDSAVRKMREMFNRLKSEAKTGTAGLSALMMGMMGGILPMGGGQQRRLGGSIGPMIRQQRTAVQSQRQAQAGGLSALMMGMMGGVIPMGGSPRGAGGSISSLIRQQRTAVQSRRQAQAASAVTPSFMAALPLMLGMGQSELTSRLRGLYGQQYTAPAMGGRSPARPGRIANLLYGLGRPGGFGTGALSGQLFSGGLTNPGISPTGYIGRSAISPRYVNYPPGLPPAYGSGFIEPSAYGSLAAGVTGRYGMTSPSPQIPIGGVGAGGGSFVPMQEVAISANQARVSLSGFIDKLKRIRDWVTGEDLLTPMAGSNRQYTTGAAARGGILGGKFIGAGGAIESYRGGFRTSGMMTPEGITADEALFRRYSIAQNAVGGSMPLGAPFAGRGGAIGSYAFPMAGAQGPSSPLGRITYQSSMFGPNGPGGGWFGGFRNYGGGGGGNPPGGPPGGPPSGGGGRIPMSGFGGANGSFGRNLLGGQSGIIGEIADEFSYATKQVLLFGTAYKALAAITSFPGHVADAVGKLESFNNQLDAVTGGGELAKQSIALIESTVAKMNIPLDSARQGFIKLYASMRPAGIDGATINSIFTGVASAAATFGMSSDQVDRMTNALAQMASKGQIMAEELKGQLGDVFPQAVSLFAKAAGYLNDSMSDVEKSEGISKFLKAMEDGTFKGKAMQQMLKNVGVLLNQDFGPSAIKAGTSFNNQINKLNNALKTFYEAFAPAAGAFLAEFVGPITNGLGVVAEAVRLALSGEAIKGNQLAEYFRNELFPQLVNVKEGLLTAAKTIGDFGAALGVVIRPLAQFLLGNKEMVSVIARAVTMFAVYKAGMAAATAVGLVPLISNIIKYNQVFRIFVAQTMQGATSMQALKVAAAQTGQSTSAAATGIRTLGTAIRTMVTTTIIGFALVAISMLIEKIQALQAAADRVRGARTGVISRLRTSAQSGGAQGLQSTSAVVQAEIDSKARMAETLSRMERGEPVKAADVEHLRSQGVPVDRIGQRITSAGAYTGRFSVGLGGSTRPVGELTEVSRQVRQELEATRQGFRSGMGVAGRDAAVVDARTAAQAGIQVGDLVGGGDGKGGKDKKERESQIPILQERLKLAQDLAKIEAEIDSAKLKQNELEQARLEGEKELRQIKFEIAEVMLDTETPAAEKQLKLAELQVKEQQTLVKIRHEASLKIVKDLLAEQKSLDDIVEKSKGLLRDRKRYSDMLAKGITPEQAKLTLEVENEFIALEKNLKLKRAELDIQIKLLKAKKAAGTKIDEGLLSDLEQGLKQYDKRIQELPGEGKSELERRTQANAPLDRATRLRELMSQAKSDLEKLADPVNLLTGAAQSMGDAFSEAFTGLVSGALTAQQALAGIFKKMGDYFLEATGRMIAQWIYMKAIGLVAKMFGGGTAPAAEEAPAGLVLAANGGIMKGGWSAVTPFASGGLVKGPTLGLVGEGRFNEAVVPLPNGKSIPVDLGGNTGNNISTNIVVNVSNGQASSQVSGQGGQAFGREIEGAVRQVILKETRPGGIIYNQR